MQGPIALHTLACRDKICSQRCGARTMACLRHQTGRDQPSHSTSCCLSGPVREDRAELLCIDVQSMDYLAT